MRDNFREYTDEQRFDVQHELLQRTVIVVAPEQRIERQQRRQQRQHPEHAGRNFGEPFRAGTNTEREQRNPHHIEHQRVDQFAGRTERDRQIAPQLRNERAPGRVRRSNVVAITTAVQSLPPDPIELQRLVCCTERRAAAGAMVFEQLAHERTTGVIECGERFVEKPQRRVVEPKARQCRTTLLACRQVLARREFVARETDAREQRRKHIVIGIRTFNGRIPLEIFEWAQLWIQPAAMTDVTQCAGALDMSFEVARQPGETTQQRRFAAAIGTAEFDHVARPDVDVEIVEQHAAVPFAA